MPPPDDRATVAVVGGEATITGVGFFDRPHATGHAPFGIELHAVLFFSSSDCP